MQVDSYLASYIIYVARPVKTTKNALKVNLRKCKFSKFSGGGHAPRPP